MKADGAAALVEFDLERDFARLPPEAVRALFRVDGIHFSVRGAAVVAGRLRAYARAVFEAYWGDLEDISQASVLEKVAKRAGLEPTTFFARIAEQEIKDRLRANTDELIERGGFGSPTIVVDGDDLYFGNDRLPLVREALKAAP